MATRFINTASTAGGDGTTNDTTGVNRAYASWDEFEVEEEATLTEAMILNCDGAGGVDTSTIGLGGFNTTATNTFTAQQNTSGSPYTLQLNTVTSGISEDYVTFKDITIETIVAGRDIVVTSNPSAGDNLLEFNNVLFKTPSTSSTTEILTLGQSNLIFNMINCRYEGGARFLNANVAGDGNIDYCTIVLHQNNIGILSNSVNVTIRNTFVGKAGGANTAGDYWTGGTFSGSNNASSDTTATASFTGTNVNSVVTNDVLTSTTPGSVDFHLVAGTNALVEAGTPIATTVDYEGDARDGTSPDIGADERAAGDSTAPNLSLPTSASITNVAVTLGATTDEANGTAHAIITANGDQTLPTNQEIIDGNAPEELFEAVDLAISATGAFTFASITGLTGNTTYGYAIVHEDAAGNEDAGSRVNGTFTTQSASLTISAITGGESLTSLEYMILSTQDLSTATIVKKGTGETTDASGNLVVDLNDVSVSSGQTVWYLIKDTTETNAAQGPGTVSIA